MNRYIEMSNKHKQEVHKFPLGFAFSDEQFNDMMNNWGLSPKNTHQICSLCGGIFIRKCDIPAYQKMVKRHRDELQTAISSDATGEGFIYEMFYHELQEHEFGYTMDYSDTLEALGYTMEDVQNNKALFAGLQKATAKIINAA